MKSPNPFINHYETKHPASDDAMPLIPFSEAERLVAEYKRRYPDISRVTSILATAVAAELLKTYQVTVTVHLEAGETAESAEIEAEDLEHPFTYTITATSPEEAEERALDVFHSTIAIGVLDAVKVEATAKETEAH